MFIPLKSKKHTVIVQRTKSPKRKIFFCAFFLKNYTGSVGKEPLENIEF
jgi:hypothetical protein